MCRKKKIKCDGKMPACTHCINYKTECVFTQVEKKRNPPKGYANQHCLLLWLVLMAGQREVYRRARESAGQDGKSSEIIWHVYIGPPFGGAKIMANKCAGLLSEDDNGRTDLGTLEKRLADKNLSQSRRASAVPGSNPTSPSQSTPNNESTPRSTITSPEPQQSTNGDKRHSTDNRNGSKEPESEEAENVEALSDMMCSLVTNNCGETRYIGTQHETWGEMLTLIVHRILLWVLYIFA